MTLDDLPKDRRAELYGWLCNNEDLALALLIEGFAWSAEGANGECDFYGKLDAVKAQGIQSLYDELKK